LFRLCDYVAMRIGGPVGKSPKRGDFCVLEELIGLRGKGAIAGNVNSL